MNNNNMKFDPMTGEPIQNINEPAIPVVNEQIDQPTVTVDQPIIDQQPQVIEPNIAGVNPPEQIPVQNVLQNIPTVDQNEQDFINNIQQTSKEKKVENKEGVNFVFIIILFAILLAIVYFLFPILLNYV